MANSLACGIGCGICSLLTLLIFILVSIGTVEPIEYGIIYNSLTKKVDTETIYPGGWYFIGPINSFITYPATLVNMDFTDYDGANARPIIVKDKDGQEIRLSFSIQYRLFKEDIGKLYSEFQKGYEATFISYIDSVVRKTVEDFPQNAFWAKRTESGDKIRVAIDEKLKDIYASCEHI